MPHAAKHSAASALLTAAGQEPLRRTSRPQHPGRLQGAGQRKPDLPVLALPAASHTRREKPCLLSLTTKAARPAPGSRPCQAPCGRRQPTRPMAHPRPAGNRARQPRSEGHRREPAPARPRPPAPGKPGQPTGSPGPAGQLILTANRAATGPGTGTAIAGVCPANMRPPAMMIGRRGPSGASREGEACWMARAGASR